MCYIDNGDSFLMLKRTKKENDIHEGLTISVGGKFEPGESPEDCIIREVKEETGIKIKNIRYFGSQPWPYPCGLMVGFNADYDGGDIHLQQSELSKGAWFTKDNLPTIPEPLSIARMILDDWINKTSI